jgi:hypothetical protein
MKKRCIFWWISPLVTIPAKEYFDLATESTKKQYGFWGRPEWYGQKIMMSLETAYVGSDLLLLWLHCTGYPEGPEAKRTVADLEKIMGEKRRGGCDCANKNPKRR